MVVILDYGMGNIGSIYNMLKKIGTEALISNDRIEIERADKIILPGVGNFDNGMKNLIELGLDDEIKKQVIINKKPLLGICLGMQLLGRKSEEGSCTGLSLVEFDNKRFSFSENKLKIPHMGWDTVILNMNDKLLEGITGLQRYYFVHSYHAICDNTEDILMTCDYGYPFPAAIKRGNIYGVQFHPEKSHKFGMDLLTNFIRSV